MPHTIKCSVIIPHLGRESTLKICLESLRWSAATCGFASHEWEAIVVGHVATGEICSVDIPIRIVCVETSPPFLRLRAGEPKPFWKNRLLNSGIAKSRGEVLTFLDADAVVGPRFFGCLTALAVGSNVTRLCYRVRKLPENIDRDSALAAYAKYDIFPLAHEAYGDPEADKADTTTRPVFGNSQFSIRRDVLGDLRFDESYWGRGYEDVSMIRAIWQHYGEAYCGEIITDGNGAMFHISTPLSPGFAYDRWADRNFRRYHKMRCLWIISSYRKSLLAFGPMMNEWFCYAPNVCIRTTIRNGFDPQEANIETDSILDLDAIPLSITRPMEIEA